MSSPSVRLVVRCFADEDEALVDEWPVVLSHDELAARVPSFDPLEILPVDVSVVPSLVGEEVGPYSEPVAYFLEPEIVTT